MAAQTLAFTLPEPWVNTSFPLDALAAMNFLIGPPGSGKLRFAGALCGHWANARLVEAAEPGREDAPSALERLREALRAGRGAHLIFDLPELGLEPDEQRAFMAEARAAVLAARDGARGDGASVEGASAEGASMEGASVADALVPDGASSGALYMITRSPHILDIAALDDACAVIYFASSSCAPRLLQPSREAVDRIRECLMA